MQCQEKYHSHIMVSDDVVNTPARSQKRPVYGLFRGFGYFGLIGKSEKSKIILHSEVHFYPLKHKVLPKSS